MTYDLQQPLQDVTLAMERLHQAFESRVVTLEQEGADTATMRRFTEGARAMRDSGAIFLAWAQHYARQVAHASGESLEEEGFLDEGTMV